MPKQARPPSPPSNVTAIRPHQVGGIQPPEGWAAQSPFGLLRLDVTDAGRLARVEDVAAWMAADKPRDQVIYDIFSRLIQDDAEAAESLCVVNARGYAQPLFRDGQPSPKTRSFWQHLPEVRSDSSVETVARDIAEGWLRAWPGLADPATDHQWKTERAIERNKEADIWPDDRLLLGLLRTVAIPLDKAHALWGYGRVVGAASSLVPVSEPVSPFPLADIPALAVYRNAHKRASWEVGNQRDLVTAAVQARGGTTAAWASVGAEIGVKRQTLQTAVKRERKRQTSKVFTSFPAVEQLTASNSK